MKRIPRRIDSLPRAGKQFLMAGWDASIAPLCLAAAIAVRLGSMNRNEVVLWTLMAVAAAATPPLFWLFGLYREITRYIGPRYAWLLVQGCMASALVLMSAALFLPDRAAGFPRTAIIIYALFLFCAAGGARLIVRHVLRSSAAVRQRVAIYGAGDAGAGLLSAISQDRATKVVAFFDDDPARIGGALRGVPILRTSGAVEAMATLRADALLVALSPAQRGRKTEFLESMAAAGVRVLAVPTLGEIRDGRVQVDALRPVAIEDLLGRPAVQPDAALLRANVAGKTVLVTGAGGSIGSELCRQILRLGPRSLVLVDNGEFNLYRIHEEMAEALERLDGATSRPRVVRCLASVTDAACMDGLFAFHRPDTVYHAAAYKHLPILEESECEGADVNVLGTLRVAEAALTHGTANVVFVSTDKAVRPTSVLGATKRMGEMVLQALAEERREGSHTVFTMVRFGNVLGSSGSVIPIFHRQVAAGGPLTVTHPDVKRYFMTIPEACELILQAGAMGRGGDVFVLDMGEQVNIAHLARRMIQLAGRTVRDADNPGGEIEIRFTGLRPAEKLSEELVIGSDVAATDHPGILRAKEHMLSWRQLATALQQLEAAISQHDPREVRSVLERTVADYRTPSAKS